jgi:hypothetical protein
MSSDFDINFVMSYLTPAFESVRDYVSLIRSGGNLAEIDGLLVIRAQMAALGWRRSDAVHLSPGKMNAVRAAFKPIKDGRPSDLKWALESPTERALLRRWDGYGAADQSGNVG